jgi:perosamine synthetase
MTSTEAATYIPYGRHSIDQSDLAAVAEALQDDWITQGPGIRQFEEAVITYTGALHAVAVNSGTAALHAAVYASGVGPGDEIITTPLTFAASANCALYQGALPRFADVDPETLNLDPEGVEQAITARTKAIIAVDFGGQPAALNELAAIAERHRIIVIEDAAHSLGARYKGERVGSLVPLTTFSFHPVKHITTGEGGMVMSSEARFSERMRRFRNHGITTEVAQRQRDAWFYEMVDLGYNYRITDIQCALGIAQLRRLDTFLARRRAIAWRYDAALAGRAELSVPVVRPYVEHAYHLYPVLLNLDALCATRDTIFCELRSAGIGVNVHYIPVHYHPYYRQRFGYREGDYPVAENAFRRLLSLPMFPGLTESDQDRVLDVLCNLLDKYRR